MKDMNWPERVAYLENQLADSDRDNRRLREFIEGLPDGDEIVRLRGLHGLLSEAREYITAYQLQCDTVGGLPHATDLAARIDAALAGAAVQPPVLNERDARDPVVEAQHDETGRMWRGRRSMIPRRYFECVTPSPTDAAP